MTTLLAIWLIPMSICLILLFTRSIPEEVKGSCFTHKVYAIDPKKGCLIGNNKGHMNGWTKNVYGLAHKLEK